MKKILLSLGTLVTVVAPIITIISCGTNKKEHSESDKPDVTPKNPKGEEKQNPVQEKQGKEKINTDNGKLNPENKKDFSNDDVVELKNKILAFTFLSKELKENLIHSLEDIKSQKDLDEVKTNFINGVRELALTQLNAYEEYDLSSFRNDISQSESVEGIAEIKENAEMMIEAKIESEKAIASEKAKVLPSALEFIENTLDKLLSGRKNILSEELTKAVSVKDVEDILILATRENAINYINSSENLSETEKEVWTTQAKSLKTRSTIGDLVNELKQRLFGREKELYLLICENYAASITTKKLNKVMALINSSSTLDEIKNIINKVYLDIAKVEAIKEINAYYSPDNNNSKPLTKYSFDVYVEKIQSSSSPLTIQNILNELRGLDPQFSLSLAWEKPFTIFPDPSDNGKAHTYIDQILTIDKIDPIIKAALLEKMKTDAINYFKGNLIEAEQVKFEKAIKGAKTSDEVIKAIQDVNLVEAKKEAIKYVNGYADLENKEKQIWIEQLNLDLTIAQLNKTMDFFKETKISHISSIKTMP